MMMKKIINASKKPIIIPFNIDSSFFYIFYKYMNIFIKFKLNYLYICVFNYWGLMYYIIRMLYNFIYNFFFFYYTLFNFIVVYNILIN